MIHVVLHGLGFVGRRRWCNVLLVLVWMLVLLLLLLLLLLWIWRQTIHVCRDLFVRVAN